MKTGLFTLILLAGTAAQAANEASVQCELYKGGETGYSEAVTIRRSELKKESPHAPLMAELSIKDVKLTVIVIESGSALGSLSVVAQLPEYRDIGMMANGGSKSASLSLMGQTDEMNRNIRCYIR